MMIKGCIGFAHQRGRFLGVMILVEGKRTKNIYLPYPVWYCIARLWGSKNILRKFLFKKDITFEELDKSKLL